MAPFLLLQQSPNLPAGIVATVDQFTDFLLGYVAALAAVGALGMALIEAAKKLWDSRTKFHAKRVTSWVEKVSFTEQVVLSEPPRVPEPVLALAELLQLCTGVSHEEATAKARGLLERRGRLRRLHALNPDPAHAVFALDLERMMGAIQEAGDVALTTPRKYANLYLLMTSGASQDDVREWFERGASGMSEIANTEPSAETRRQIKDMADRFTRLRQIMKRKLDAFQLYTGAHWASYNQFAAIVVGFLTMLGVLLWMARTGGPDAPSSITIVVLSLFGGILSPIAKDLVSALKRVKSG